jgi:cold shock protein
MKTPEFGVVKKYDSERGYGFIIPDQPGDDVFVHAEALKRSGIPDLARGDRVQFVLVPDRRGFRAADIRLLT